MMITTHRPEAFEKQETNDTDELPAAVAEQEDNGENDVQAEEKAPLTGAAPTIKANGFTMLDTSFAETMHLNRNRRKGVFDEDEDDDDEDSD